MAARKPPAKKAPKKTKKAEEDVYVIEDEDEHVDAPAPTSIETDVVLGAIEFHDDEENPDVEPHYHLTFHAELPEHIAQHLFSNHVQEGRITVEFRPADPALRRRGTLVRR